MLIKDSTRFEFGKISKFHQKLKYFVIRASLRSIVDAVLPFLGSCFDLVSCVERTPTAE